MASRASAVVAAVAVTASGGVLSDVAPAAAHSYNNVQAGCVVNTTPRFQGNFTSTSLSYLISVGGDSATAAQEAANGWSWWTDIDFNGSGGVQVRATSFSDPTNVGLAGRIQNTSTTGCLWSYVEVAFNSSHLDDTGLWNVNEKRCIYGHELGHALGLGHSNIAAHNDTGGAEHSASDSILRGQVHDQRCHVFSPPYIPRSSDVADINAKY